MSELGVVFLCFSIVFFALSIYIISVQRSQYEKERESWNAERKDLLDRIQAPTFAEYSNKVIKEKKLEQPQEEEKPVEFIS